MCQNCGIFVCVTTALILLKLPSNHPNGQKYFLLRSFSIKKNVRKYSVRMHQSGLLTSHLCRGGAVFDNEAEEAGVDIDISRGDATKEHTSTTQTKPEEYLFDQLNFR